MHNTLHSLQQQEFIYRQGKGGRIYVQAGQEFMMGITCVAIYQSL